MKNSIATTDRPHPLPRAVPPADSPASAGTLVPQRKVSLIRCLLLACLVGFASLASPLYAVNPLSMDVLIKGIDRPEPPRMVDDVLILTFREERPSRSVAARFAHEGYRVLHAFSRNEYGVFVLDYPVPEGLREIRYRIVVDGLWRSDPSNPRVETDPLGTEFSLVVLEREPARSILNPRLEPDGKVTFSFRGAPSKRVAIAGDWNGWDPFMDFLTETESGVYRISLRVLPGRHWYYFASDGQRFLDMSNPAMGVDPDGKSVSYFSLPG
ncbi:MAG: hypothetical protein NT005_16220 [Spirochaetes bacterium]|nr:hypothetical protein [Spirochaetota bacterium]